jgi:hypothetical protein
MDPQRTVTTEGTVRLIGVRVFAASLAESLARKISGICRKFAMKNLRPCKFCTVKIFDHSFLFRRPINRLSIAQVR